MRYCVAVTDDLPPSGLWYIEEGNTHAEANKDLYPWEKAWKVFMDWCPTGMILMSPCGTAIRVSSYNMDGPSYWATKDGNPVADTEGNRLFPYSLDSIPVDVNDLERLPNDILVLPRYGIIWRPKNAPPKRRDFYLKMIGIST